MKARFPVIIAILTIAFAQIHCGDDDPLGKFDSIDCRDDVIKGHLRDNCTLAGIREISGKVFIRPGRTLTIIEGSVVRADPEVFTAIIVLPGGQIVAQGTANNPIVFTSNAEERAPGDWGGIVIAGEAPVSVGDNGAETPEEQEVTGDTEVINSDVGQGFYGGNDEEASSGSLRYVRIEYTGRSDDEGNAFDGLTLAGAGSETGIQHVQVHRSAGRGIRILGGHVDLSYIVVSDSAGSAFTIGQGWQGNLHQTLVLVGESGGLAFEIAGADGSFQTDSIFSNLTLLAVPAKGDGSTGQPGLLTIGGGAGVSVYNSYVAGFDGDSSATDGTDGQASIIAVGNATSSATDVALNFQGVVFEAATGSTWANAVCLGNSFSTCTPGGVSFHDSSGAGVTPTVFSETATPTNVSAGGNFSDSSSAPNYLSLTLPNSGTWSAAGMNLDDLTGGNVASVAQTGAPISTSYIGAFGGADDDWADGWVRLAE